MSSIRLPCDQCNRPIRDGGLCSKCKTLVLKFKVGNKIKCIDDFISNFLKLGQIYYVIDVDEDFHDVKLSLIENGKPICKSFYESNRFELAKE